MGTALCSFVFLGLTVDTFRQMPQLTNAHNLSPEVIKGKHLWDVNNCMGCHTLLGEGGYYAPELTKVYERRGPAFIKAMLTDPESMYPGRRKMQAYDLTEEEMDAFVAFFKWVGEMDLQGFPPKPQLLPVAVPAAGQGGIAETMAQPKVFNQMCVACHSMNGQGGMVGPALDNIGSKMTKAELIAWITDPKAVKPETTMPKLPLSEADVIELAAYLTLLKSPTSDPSIDQQEAK
ncbi:MAG: c-type cytochrome [Bdellovibrionales bacterium]|nr:c-type cytochrome [Bdellovibrionales bacterium]